MTIAIVAYPRLDEDNRQRIESFRARHDPQVSRIALHFTLVFHVDAVPEALKPEIDAVARSSEPIGFAIRRTDVVPDPIGDFSNIVLVPGEGGRQIEALHDSLYAGGLRPHLRSDIPFIPHITVGATRDMRLAERWVKAFDVHSRVVVGTVVGIDLVDVSQHRVQSIARYSLGNADAREE
jgi:2'-5' RNA ligase